MEWEEILGTHISNMDGVYDHKYLYAWKEGNIFCAAFKGELFIGLAAAKEIVEFRRSLFKDQYFCTMLFCPKNMNCISPEARSFFASKEASENIVKGAFIMKSPFMKFLGNAFLKLNTVPVPTKIFTKKEDALRWLRK